MKTWTLLAAMTVILSVPNANAADGKAIYNKECSKCHGADGKASTKMGKKLKCRDLSDPAVQSKLTDSAIAKSITDGVKEGGKTRMKAIKGLSGADVSAVVKYVRSLKK
jgi:mono/diheme cytochrome c family protein